MTKRILFTGCFFSGRTALLGAIARRFNGEKISEHWDVDGLRYLFCVTGVGCLEFPLECAVTEWRSSTWGDALKAILEKGLDPKDEMAFLMAADLLVYVVDSQRKRLQGGTSFLRRTKRELDVAGRQPQDIPVIFALNKRDCRNIAPADELVSLFKWPNCKHVETVATEGIGIDAVYSLMLEYTTGS